MSPPRRPPGAPAPATGDARAAPPAIGCPGPPRDVSAGLGGQSGRTPPKRHVGAAGAGAGRPGGRRLRGARVQLVRAGAQRLGAGLRLHLPLQQEPAGLLRPRRAALCALRLGAAAPLRRPRGRRAQQRHGLAAARPAAQPPVPGPAPPGLGRRGAAADAAPSPRRPLRDGQRAGARPAHLPRLGLLPARGHRHLAAQRGRRGPRQPPPHLRRPQRRLDLPDAGDAAGGPGGRGHLHVRGAARQPGAAPPGGLGSRLVPGLDAESGRGHRGDGAGARLVGRRRVPLPRQAGGAGLHSPPRRQLPRRQHLRTPRTVTPWPRRQRRVTVTLGVTPRCRQ